MLSGLVSDEPSLAGLQIAFPLGPHEGRVVPGISSSSRTPDLLDEDSILMPSLNLYHPLPLSPSFGPFSKYIILGLRASIYGFDTIGIWHTIPMVETIQVHNGERKQTSLLFKSLLFLVSVTSRHTQFLTGRPSKSKEHLLKLPPWWPWELEVQMKVPKMPHFKLFWILIQ